MSLSRLRRFQYFAWAASTLWTGRNRSCPACNGTETSLIKRKYLFTSLWHCASCDLRFRVPKDDPPRSAEFYQEEYTQGFTTDCPSETALASLIAMKFADAEKEFRSYVEVLRAAGVRPGDAILDFGFSWGYGAGNCERPVSVSIPMRSANRAPCTRKTNCRAILSNRWRDSGAA